MPGTLLIGFRAANGGYTIVSAANPLPVTGGGGGGGGDASAANQELIIAGVGDPGDAAWDGSDPETSLIGATKAVFGELALADLKLGELDDAAWDGTGNPTSLIALWKRLASTDPILVSRVAYGVVRPITPGTNVTAGQAVLIACTVAGNQTLELSGGGTISVPVVVGATWIDNIAVIDAPASGTTATATVSVLATA